MKKSLSLLLLFAMVFVLFSANIAAQTGEEATITVWCWDPTFNIYAMEEAAKMYADIAPNVEIKIVETAWEDIQTKLTTAVTAGQTDTLPDILLMQDNALIKNVSNFPGTFVDITDSGIDFSKFASFKTALSTVNGRNYAVPFDNGAAISALRIDVLEEAGYNTEDLTDITWTEFMEIAKDILDKTDKPILSSIAGEPDLLMVMLQSAGIWMFDDNGEVYISDNEAIKEIIEIYLELVKSGVLIEVNDWDQYISTLNRGTVAGTINGCWIIGSIVAQEDQEGMWRVTNIPRLDKTANSVNYSNQGGSSWLVLSSSDHPDIAVDFLKNTFAGSTDLYETILPSSGALATYLPAGNSHVYNEPHDFFSGQTIYADITEYASKVPQVNYGIYNYEARDAIGTAITQILQGADIDTALKEAEETVKFLMW